MSRSSWTRPTAVLAAGLLALATLAACARSDDRVASDTSAGVIDSAPRSTLAGVAASLSDENVLAQLDTALAGAIVLDTLAQRKATDARVRAMAAGDISSHNLIRRGTVDLADRLKVAPVLPDQRSVRDFAAALRDLGGKTGADFDRAYLEHTITLHQGMLKDIDQALDGRANAAVKTFLEQTRSNLDAHVKHAQAMRDSLK